ncbi:M20/M25/M40 family metallo-hydrolase [Ferrimicrobium acidiphilum]|uniref:M20/M25/M40 family metallo-hydrolase n=1 Tax=Ferrimicrobium acidiphilum TaxID=121039 RepID=UPI0023F03C5E|nr:M20/M25/M40 family metallo-hydrolase [Ferrimicrobium acidiphilum]
MLTFDGDDVGYVSELAEYVAIPSVSRDATSETMHSAAEWLAAQLSFAGGHLIETAGNPVVMGEWLAGPQAPTVLVYGHYDVQPTGDLAEWESDPFTLTVDGDIMRGRGSTDDKGPVYIVLKVAQAIIEQEGNLPLNVKFLFEGEEEIGSPNLPGFVASHASKLCADLVISADGAMWRPEEPSLSVGSKGLITMDLEVSGANCDLHSGRYGGIVANPTHALSQVLAGLHTADGRVAVAGFYDGIAELSNERREEIANVVFDERHFLEGLGLREGFGEAGYSLLEQLWEWPTLEVNGVRSGGKYTVIPHSAVANISCRLVPGQDPDTVVAALQAHVDACVLPGVDIRLRVDKPRIPAYTIDRNHPAIEAATVALNEVYPGQRVLLDKIAGTLPPVTLFEEHLGAKTLFFSFSTADERLHAPNEYMRIRRLREGMRAWERLWRLLGTEPYQLGSSSKESSIDHG